MAGEAIEGAIELYLLVEEPVPLNIAEEGPLFLGYKLMGPRGIDGAGIPAGGTTGQVLKKASNADLHVSWQEDAGGDYNNLINKPTIPDELADLAADATHRTVTDAEKSTWNGKSNFDGNYNSLTNKPTIPDELADLTADATHRTVTDAEKSTWNGKSNFDGNYNSLTNKPTIPDELADLTADATHRTVTDAEKSTWNGKSNFDGNYNSLTNKPTIPDELADLAEDATHRTITDVEQAAYEGAVTHAVSAHAPSNAQKNSDITKAEIEAKLTGEISSHSHASSGGGALYVTFALAIGTDATTGVNKTNEIPIPRAGNITKCWINGKTAPVGADLIYDINVNGTSIWSTQANRIKLVAGNTSGSQTSFNTVAVTEGQILTVDCDQTGVATKGKDITLILQIT